MRVMIIISIFMTHFCIVWLMPSSQAQQRAGVVKLAEEKQVAQSGYAFRPIQGWKVETFPDGKTMLAPLGASSPITPGIILSVGNIQNDVMRYDKTRRNLTSVGLFDLMLKGFASSANTEGIKKELVQISHKPGYMARFRFNNFQNTATEAGGQFALVLINDDSFFTLLGVASPSENWKYDREFEAVLNSVRFFPPVQR